MGTFDVGGSQLDTSWFLLLGAVLFAMGTAGVLVRRNPLIILIFRFQTGKDYQPLNKMMFRRCRGV